MAKVSPWQAGTVAVHGDDDCEWQGGFGCRESTWSMIFLRGILVNDHFGGSGWLISHDINYLGMLENVIITNLLAECLVQPFSQIERFVICIS